MSHSNGPTALQKVRAHFKAQPASEVTAAQAAQMFGCSESFVKGYVLAVLRHEGVLTLQRGRGVKAIYRGVA
jgi:response regulator of citrate/malate metabolism